MPLKAHMLPALVAILLVVLSGIMHFSWWAVAVGACALALVSLTSPNGSFALHTRPGSTIALPLILLASTLNASAATVAAFTLGRVIGWCWGI
jgi:hypothetical protein